MFDEGEAAIPLHLVSSRAFKTDVLYLVYGPAAAAGPATHDEAKVHLPSREHGRER